MFFKSFIIYGFAVLLFFVSGCGESKPPEPEERPQRGGQFAAADVPLLSENSNDKYMGLMLEEDFVINEFLLDQEILSIPIDENKNFYIIDPRTSLVRKYNSSGELVDEISTGLPSPSVIQYENGNFFILDGRQQIIYKMDKELNILARVVEGKAVEERQGNYRIFIDKRGAIYLLNFDDGIIEVFTAGFRKVREFRAPFSHQVRFVVDYEKGYLVAADILKHKIYIFNLRNGETVASFGSPGTRPGEFGPAFDIAAASGRIFVSDEENNRLQIFDIEDGRLIKSVGQEGAGEGQFVKPSGVFADPSGLIFVAERAGHRVQVFDVDGNYVRRIGQYGRNNGNFNQPSMIFGLPELGFIFVLDNDDKRVQAFNYNGQFIRDYAILSNRFNHSFGIIADGSDSVFIVSPEGERVIKYGVENMIRNVPSDNLLASNSAVDEKGNILFVNREKMKLQYNEVDGRQLNVNYNISAEKSVDIEIKMDYFTIDSKGSIYVLDRYNHRIVKYSKDGVIERTLGTNRDSDGDWRLDSGSGNGEFRNPFFMAVDFSDNLYVADVGNNRIQKFNSNGDFISSFGKSGIGDGTFIGKFTFAVSDDGVLVVCDYARSYIQLWDITGNFISRYGKFGDGPNGFVNPLAVNIDNDENIYILNSKNTDAFATSGDILLRKAKKADLFAEGLSYYRRRLFDKALEYFFDISTYRQDEKTLFYGWYSANRKLDLEKQEYFGKILKNTSNLSVEVKELLIKEGFNL